MVGHAVIAAEARWAGLAAGFYWTSSEDTPHIQLRTARSPAKATADLSRQDALLAEWYLRTTDPNIFVRCRSRRELRKAITDMVGRQMESIREKGSLPVQMR